MYVFPSWRGKPLVPTRAAASELVDENVSIAEVIDVLDEGYDCSASRRAQNIIERCKRYHKKKVLKVVVADEGDKVKIIHVGIFG